MRPCAGCCARPWPHSPHRAAATCGGAGSRLPHRAPLPLGALLSAHGERRRCRRPRAGNLRPRARPPARTHRCALAPLTALARGDRPAVEALLAADVRALADAGGEAPAGRVPVVGASRVAKLYVNLVHRHAACLGPFGWRMLNGLPALVAPGYALRVDVDADGRITAVHALLASRKLAALATPPPS